MPAVAARRASPPAAVQRWELRWLASASGYNRLFSSRRLRFLGDAQGCPAPLVCRGAGDRPEPRLVYFVYSLLMGFAALLLLPYWLVQGLRHGKYLSNLGQRLGFSFPSLANLPADLPAAIWLHAVSVGEALSGVTLARRLKEAYPDRPLIVSTTTITGQVLALQRMPFADAVIYFPLDWAFCVRRAMNAVRPSLVLILETEIWPNFLREAR